MKKTFITGFLDGFGWTVFATATAFFTRIGWDIGGKVFKDRKDTSKKEEA